MIRVRGSFSERDPYLTTHCAGCELHLECRPRRRGELANVFAQNARRFRGKNSVGPRPGAGFLSVQQIALDFAALIDAK